jgi:RecA/RadA recombinase
VTSVDTKLRASVRTQLVKDYGEHTMLPGNRMPPVRRMFAGSLALEYVMGGGYAFGRLHRFWGGFSSGKTLAMLEAMRVAQNFGKMRYEHLTYLSQMAALAGQTSEAKKLKDQAKRERDQYGDGLACLFVDAEGTFDVEQAKRMGVRTDEKSLEIARTKRIEEIGDIVQNALAAYHLVCVDSTTDTITLAELAHEEGLFQNTLAMTRAMKWQNNLLWWGDRMNDDNVILYSSHVRTTIGMSANKKMVSEHPPGGNALEHESSISLHFMKGSGLRRHRATGSLVPFSNQQGETDLGAFGKQNQSAGSEVIVRCVKNKTARSDRIVLMHHDKKTGRWDPLHDLEKLAGYFRVVSKSGSWFTLPDGSKTQSLRKTLTEDPALVHRITDVVHRCAADPQYEDQLLKGGPGVAMIDVPDADVTEQPDD